MALRFQPTTPSELTTVALFRLYVSIQGRLQLLFITFCTLRLHPHRHELLVTSQNLVSINTTSSKLPSTSASSRTISTLAWSLLNISVFLLVSRWWLLLLLWVRLASFTHNYILIFGHKIECVIDKWATEVSTNLPLDLALHYNSSIHEYFRYNYSVRIDLLRLLIYNNYCHIFSSFFCT